MNGQTLGGGVLLALGAVLWALYFLPIYAKRTRFAASEKNALRIQRTVRMLAETAEVPEEVRLEATARQALAAERMLKAQGRTKLAEHEVKLIEAKLAERAAIAEAKRAKRHAAKLKRELIKQSTWVRAVRISFALLTLASLIALVAIAALVTTGLSAVWLLAALGGIVLGAIMLATLAPRKVPEFQSSRAASAPVAKPVTVAPERRAASVHVNAAPSAREVWAAQRESQRAMLEQRQHEQLRQHAIAQANAFAEHEQTVDALAVAHDQSRLRARAAAPASAARVTPSPRVAQPAPSRPGEAQRLSTAQPIPSITPDALREMGVVARESLEAPSLDAMLSRRRNAS